MFVGGGAIVLATRGMQKAGERLREIGKERLRQWGPWVLVALTLVVLLPGNNALPLMDRDEPRYAQASREMAERGEWIVPYFNDQYRLRKPILIYWLMRIAYAGLGINEFAARLPTVICAVLTIWLTFRIGARWYSATAGFTAGLGLLTCIQMLLNGRSAITDMPMVLCVLAAHYALFELLHSDSDRACNHLFWLLYGAMGVGFLAKGPVAVALPLLTLLLYRFAFWRQPVPWRRLRPAWGLLLTLTIIGLWGIPALVRTQGEFLQVGIGEHVIKRGVTSFEGHGMLAPYYYVVTALFSLYPWIGCAGAAINAVRYRWTASNAFLVAWVVGTYVLFTCYLTKLPHYVLPAFPALMLMLGQATQPGLKTGRWATIWFWTVQAVALTLATALLITAGLWNTDGLIAGLRGVWLGGAGILASLATLAVLWRRGRLGWCGLAVAGLALSTAVLGQSVRRVSPSLRICELAAPMPANTRFASWRHGEPSMIFYTNRRWTELADEAAVTAFLAERGPLFLVYHNGEVRLDDLAKKLLGRPPRAAVSAPASQPADTQWIDIEGVNSARGSWVSLRVYYRTNETP